MTGERNGKPVLGEGEEQTQQFQESARAADVGITMLMHKGLEAGHSPLAVAAGTLTALVRFHIMHLGIPPIEQPMVHTLYPAIKRTVKALRDKANEVEKAEVQPQPTRAH